MGSSVALEHPGRKALEALDEVLREKPDAEGHAFSVATEHMATFRDRLIDERDHSPEGRQRLERVNAVISMVLAGHFPLGSVPWQEIEGARGWLVDVLREEEARGH